MMAKRIDITGKRYGLLTVLSIDSTRKRIRLPGTDVFWRCKCDCGNEVVVKRGNLTSKATKSCGCWKALVTAERNRTYTLLEEERIFRRKLRMYKTSAKRRNKQWELTDEDFRRLMRLPCFYCGVPSFHGVDRANNAEGYTLGNSRPCCTICNIAKYTLSEIDFLAWVSRVYKYQNLGGQ